MAGAVGVAAALVLAGCGPTTAASDEPAASAGRRRPDARQAAAAVVHAGAVRRLLRRASTRATTRTRASTSRSVEGGTDIVPQSRARRRRRSTTRSRGCRRRWRRASRAPGSPTSAQIFQRSGTLQVAFADTGISTAADLEGKKVGNWGYGNEFELFAGMTKAGLDPATDVDAGPAAVRHERVPRGRHRRRPGDDVQRVRPDARGREPRHGRAVPADDFTAINWNDEGTAMLQDAIWANTEKLAGRRRRTRTRRSKFIKASLKGWIYARDNPEEAAGHRRRGGLAARHQPPAVADQRGQQADLAVRRTASAWSTRTRGTQTVEIALETKNDQGATVITAEPDAETRTPTSTSRRPWRS